MNRERYQQVMQIVDQLVDRPVADRPAALDHFCNGDVSLRREVEQLLDQQNSVSAFLEHSPLEAVTDAHADSMIGRRIGPYRILKEIGRGGMGAVYKAVRDDDEYQTEVAIKLIKRGMDTDYILRRFRNERQILADLNHPNIARLLDGGTTEDGLPYFVMEYIDGRAIDEYCNQEDLSPTERLVLFRSVCAAVNYAHQNLVVHLDLKPSNILISKSGAPKLLDFGIARLLQKEGHEPQTVTAIELRVMTPDYASPEQISGGAITTVSDVHSLGVVLYQLLTGQLPYRFKSKTPEEVARLVCEQDPEKPSRAVRSNWQSAKSEEDGNLPHGSKSNPQSAPRNSQFLKGDLDAIVMMALRKEPQRRYSSVEQFSEDIHRYLTGLPVLAHRDSLWYRSAKLVRRHKPAALAALIILFLLSGGVAATAWQAHVARSERVRAERRFNDVRQLANTFMFELNEEIAREPTKARELLVKRALEYLDSLAQEARDDPSLQRELATAYQKVGDVQSELHGPNVGNSQSASDSYRKSLTLRQALWASNSKDIQLGLELSASYNRMGDILSKTGMADGALAHYRKALDLGNELLSINAKNVAVRRSLAQTHIVLGRALLKTSSLTEVLENFNQAVAIREALAGEDPANTELQRELPAAYVSLGYALTEKGEVLSALDLYQKSLAINESLLAGEPGNARLRRAVFDSNWWVGVALAEAGRTDESLTHLNKALAMAQQLSSADSTNIQARNDLADAFMETANTLAMDNNPSEALKHYRKAIENYEFVWAADRRNAHARRQVFYTHSHMGDAQAQAGDIKGAIETFRRTVAAFAELATADPANTEIQTDLAISYRKLGETLMLTGDLAGATDNFHRALPLMEKLTGQSPLNARRKRDLALTYLGLGKVKADRGRQLAVAGRELLQEARGWYQKGLDIWERLQREGTLRRADGRRPVEVAREIARLDRLSD